MIFISFPMTLYMKGPTMRLLSLILSNAILVSGSTVTEPSPEERYMSAINDITESITARDDIFTSPQCERINQAIKDLSEYQPQMTDESLRTLAETNFRPFLEFVYRRACTPYGTAGSPEDYARDSLAATPAGPYLSGTPLLQALIDRNAAAAEPLIKSWNEERMQQGLRVVVIADYPNSVVGGTSTIIYIPGWPNRPQLDQWLQVQRTVGSMFFISLEPLTTGYASYIRSARMMTAAGATTIASDFSEMQVNCLSCHNSGKPLRIPTPADPIEAAKVEILVDAIVKYPAQTHHPLYNPPADFPGLGTSGALSLEDASYYAGREISATELVILNTNTSCNNCHNGSYQNPLQGPFGGVIGIMMRNGFMPPGKQTPMDNTSRQLALTVMSAAYRETLKSYFLQPSSN